MLTLEDRWRLNQARKLSAAAQELLGEIVIRQGDPDSTEILQAAEQLAEAIGTLQVLTDRFRLPAACLPFAGEVL